MAIGATLGAPLGSKLSQILFEAGVRPAVMLQIAAGLLVVQLALYALIQARAVRGRVEEAKVAEAPSRPGEGSASCSRTPTCASSPS